MSQLLFQAELHTGQDVVATRQRGRHIAQALGFDGHEQVRIATAVSEVARLAAVGARGRIEFLLEEAPEACLLIRVEGPRAALASGPRAERLAPGPALAPAQRLMDRLELRPDGEERLVLEMARRLPGPAPARAALESLRSSLERQRRASAVDELQRQNEELLRTLGELQARQAEVDLLNRELESTNRGVVALYAELEEKAEALRRASDMKTRFISNISHELRTPLGAILNLARLLLDRMDGPLNAEQERQVRFILESGKALQELIDDLLDLTKIESGRVDVVPSRFSVAQLFSALRGMLRPLQVHPEVALIFDEPAGLPELCTDERKLSQILRNLVANALKFTHQGQVRVWAQPGPRDTVVFAVQDTGVGIAPEDQERIFEEFVQVQGPHQHGVKGTGLGLPLSRRLAELLGGSLTVESQPGKGSTFYATVERDISAHREAGGEEQAETQVLRQRSGQECRVLIIDDDEVSRYLLRRLLADLECSLQEAATGPEGLRLAQQARSTVIFLDLHLPGMDGLEVLEALRRKPATRDIPVIIYTNRSLTEQERRRLGPAVQGILHKRGLTREAVLEQVHQVFAGCCPSFHHQGRLDESLPPVDPQCQ